MSDSADATSDDHWGRLAFELGLEPDPPRPAPADQPVAKEKIEPPSPPPSIALEETAEPDDEPPAAPARGRRRRADSDRGSNARPDREIRAEEPSPHERESADADERDQRIAIADGGEPPLAMDDGEPHVESADGPPADGPQKRRRRRSRRKKTSETPVAEGAAELVENTDTDGRETDDEPEAVPADDDESAPEAISDWNVPSWNDLIASLYRPDR